MRLINLGCSFSYGNVISEYETFADKHISPGTLIAEYLDIPEVNIASPGLSLDGVLRRLNSFEFESSDLYLVGLPPNLRFQTVSVKVRNQDKARTKVPNSSEWRQNAFNQGPKIPADWFVTKKWSHDIPGINVVETAIYWSFFLILLIQQSLADKKHILYNSVHGHMQQETTKPEIQTLKDKIVLYNYYKPGFGMHDETSVNTKYQISRDDMHPNHVYYKKWAEDFIKSGFIKKII